MTPDRGMRHLDLDHLRPALQATHPDGHDARVEVRWGASWQPTSLEPAGTTHVVSHSGFDAGSHSVWVRSVDRFGQQSSSTAVAVAVREPPRATVEASGIQDDRVTLQGAVGNRGGADSVSATYVIRDAAGVVASQSYASVTGSMSAHTFTGLLAGKRYSYAVEVENEVFSSTSWTRWLQTASTTSALPVVDAPPGAEAGSSVSVELEAGGTQDVEFQAEYDDGSSTILLPQYRGGTWWNLKTPSREPDAMRMTWQSAYGAQGEYAVAFTDVGGPYRPDGIEWTAQRADGFAKTLQSEAREAFAGNDAVSELSAGTCTAVPRSGPAAPFVAAGCAGVGLGAGAGILVNSLRAAAVVSVVFVPFVVEPLEGRPPVPNACMALPGEHAVRLTVSSSVEATAASQGVSVSELEQAMANACPFASEIGKGSARWTYEVGRALVFLVTHGTEVVDAFKIQLPSIVDSQDFRLEDLLVLEIVIAAKLSQDLKNIGKELPGHGHGKAPGTCQGARSVAVILDDADSGGIAAMPDMTMDCASYNAFVGRLRTAQTVGEFVGGQSYADLIMGDLTWSHTHTFAKTQQLSADTANWFWDNGATATSCNPNNPQLVRRCLDSEWKPRVGKVDWTKVSIDLGQLEIKSAQDYLELGYLDFEDGGTRHYRDSVAAKGTFLEDLVFDGLTGGKDFMQAAKDQMLFMTTPTVDANADADVKIPYRIVETVGGDAWVVVHDP